MRLFSNDQIDGKSFASRVVEPENQGCIVSKIQSVLWADPGQQVQESRRISHLTRLEMVDGGKAWHENDLQTSTSHTPNTHYLAHSSCIRIHPSFYSATHTAKMQYVPFASDIEIPFYAALASHKINHDKLDDSARKLLGLYEIRPSDPPEKSSRMQIHGNALTSDE